MKMARLLFLDDDMLTLQLMEKIAIRMGYEAIICDAAEDAHKAIIEKKPDMVLVDMSLKEMSGLSFIRSIRTLPEAAKIPIVVVSAGTALDDETEALKAGATGYVQKPLTPDVMIRVVQKYYQPMQ
jgi:DNA-binding response OmpR family regulator